MNGVNGTRVVNSDIPTGQRTTILVGKVHVEIRQLLQASMLERPLLKIMQDIRDAPKFAGIFYNEEICELRPKQLEVLLHNKLRVDPFSSTQ